MAGSCAFEGGARSGLSSHLADESSDLTRFTVRSGPSNCGFCRCFSSAGGSFLLYEGRSGFIVRGACFLKLTLALTSVARN